MRPNGLAQTRLGYAVGRRVGGAVVRNRVRRRLRALVDELLAAHVAALASFEQNVEQAEPSKAHADEPPKQHPRNGAAAPSPALDIVITAFAEAAAAPFDALRRDLASALRAAGVELAPDDVRPVAPAPQGKRS